jgi:hypothetical protein
MIINGGSRCNARFFAKHLTNQEENESVTLCEIRHLAAQNVADALHEMEVVALATYAKNFFYHANINPQEHEELTPQQWEIAVDRLEKNLHLVNHARFVVEHRKKGRTHRHVIWSRIAIPRMCAVAMTDDYAAHQATARELEHAFGLAHVSSVLGPEKQPGMRPTRRAKSWETFRGHKTGIDPNAMKRDITLLYRNSNSAEAFTKALNAHGYQLAKGDRTDFCIVDAAGQAHSLARRLEGVDAGTLAAFLANLDKSQLPTLLTARQLTQT